jgi:hypothetical protein
MKDRGRDPNRKTDGLLAQKIHPLADVVPFALQWFVAALFPLVHTIITFCLPVPGCPTGYLGAGGIGRVLIYNFFFLFFEISFAHFRRFWDVSKLYWWCCKICGYSDFRNSAYLSRPHM